MKAAFYGILLVFSSQCLAAVKSSLTIAVESEIETLHPIFDSTMAAKRIRDAVSRQIVRLNFAGRPEPVLIEEIPTIKNSRVRKIKTAQGADGMQVDIRFKKNAVWGDGKEITCADLIFGHQVGRSPTSTNPYADEYESVEKIEVLNSDPKSCRLTYGRVRYDFLVVFPRPLPEHIEGPIFEQYKKEPLAYDRNTSYVKNPSLPGLYNGPYRVGEWKLGSHIALVENEKYKGKKPAIKKLVFKTITNTASMEPALVSGQVDMIGSGLPLDKTLAFEKEVLKKQLPFRVETVSASIFSLLNFNFDHPILKEKYVRKALAHAVDKKKISQAFFEGRQIPAHSYASPLDPWFTDDPKKISVYEYNPRKSAQILEENGWKLGASGFREKNGQRLSFVVSGVAEQKLSEMMMVYLKDAFRAVGVDMQVKMSPARVFFAEIVRKRKFDVSFYSWVSSPDWNPRTLFDSQEIPTEANAFSGLNRSGIKNPDLDHALRAFEKELDIGKRKAHAQAALRIFTDELPLLPLYFRLNSAIIPKDLKHFASSPHQFSEYYEAENWTF